MVIRMKVGGVEPPNILKVSKDKAPKGDKGKKGIVEPGLAAPKVLKNVEAKIKKLEQEVQKIEKSDLPRAEKAVLLKNKKAELDSLTRQEARLKSRRIVVPSARKRTVKKDDAVPSENSPVAIEKKLKGLKTKLKEAEKNVPAAQENVQNLKAKVRLLENQLAAKKGGMKI